MGWYITSEAYSSTSAVVIISPLYTSTPPHYTFSFIDETAIVREDNSAKLQCLCRVVGERCSRHSVRSFLLTWIWGSPVVPSFSQQTSQAVQPSWVLMTVILTLTENAPVLESLRTFQQPKSSIVLLAESYQPPLSILLLFQRKYLIFACLCTVPCVFNGLFSLFCIFCLYFDYSVHHMGRKWLSATGMPYFQSEWLHFTVNDSVVYSFQC